jgi:hypothetical protein
MMLRTSCETTKEKKMSRLLDRSSERDVASHVLEAVTELGLLNHELIPGVLRAAFRLAEDASDPNRALDEGAELWADGFPPVGEDHEDGARYRGWRDDSMV